MPIRTVRRLADRVAANPSGVLLFNFLMVLLVGAAGFAAWYSLTSQAVPAVSYAEAQVADKPLLVGEIPVVARHEFVFRNTTDAPLIIDKVETTCSCTSHDESAEPIAPGENGFLRLTMAMYQSGPKSTQVKIHWSTGEQTIYTLKGEARAMAELGAANRRIDLHPGESADLALWLSTLSTEVPKLSVKGTTTDVTAEPADWKVISAGEVEKGISRRYAAHVIIVATPQASKETNLEIHVAGAEPIGVLVRIVKGSLPTG